MQFLAPRRPTRPLSRQAARRNPRRDGTPTARERASAQHIEEAKRRVAERGPSKARAGHPSLTDPVNWTRAVMSVERSSGLSESQFKGMHWGQVMGRYKRMEGAKVTSHRTKMYCLMRGHHRATSSTCEQKGVLARTRKQVGVFATALPPGSYLAHVVYVDERDQSILEVTGEFFPVTVE